MLRCFAVALLLLPLLSACSSAKGSMPPDIRSWSSKAAFVKAYKCTPYKTIDDLEAFRCSPRLQGFKWRGLAYWNEAEGIWMGAFFDAGSMGSQHGRSYQAMVDKGKAFLGEPSKHGSSDTGVARVTQTAWDNACEEVTMEHWDVGSGRVQVKVRRWDSERGPVAWLSESFRARSNSPAIQERSAESMEHCR